MSSKRNYWLNQMAGAAFLFFIAMWFLLEAAK